MRALTPFSSRQHENESQTSVLLSPERDYSDPPVSEIARPASLHRRDAILLPALSVLTMLLIFGVCEIGSRIVWGSEENGYCMVFDPVEGPHGKPNCTTIIKVPESQRVVHMFNSCGYRSNDSCGAKPASALRVAVLGSSIAEGYVTPYSLMLGSQMVRTLERACHRTVQLENLGAEACPPIYSYRHVAEALRLKPDAVVLVVNPWDLEQDIDPQLLAMRDSPAAIDRAPAPAIRLNMLQQLQAWTHDSRALAMAQHFMLQNRSTFLNLYLGAGGGDHTAFVRVPYSPAWENRMRVTETLLAGMAAKIHAAGIPFLLLGVPERAQAFMLNDHELPAGIDPWAFNNKLAQIAKRHGILYVNALQAFSQVPHPERLFFVVDGHPTAAAHTLMGDAAAQALLSASATPFASCLVPH